MTVTTKVKVPDIGDFKDAEVIELLVKPGDAVNVEDASITLETDKATMDVPAPAASTVNEVKVKVCMRGSARIVTAGRGSEVRRIARAGNGRRRRNQCARRRFHYLLGLRMRRWGRRALSRSSMTENTWCGHTAKAFICYAAIWRRR